MKNKALTDKNGEVPELTRQHIKAMKSASDVLSSELLTILAKHQVGQYGPQKASTKLL